MKQMETIIDSRFSPDIIDSMNIGSTNTVDAGPSKAHWLAKRMEEDIRARGLRAGEPFLTTTQAGRQLGISKSMAYRAMKILTDNQVLVSHPGRGTFVGPNAAAATPQQTRCCHVLLTHDLFQSSGHSTHGWLSGLAATLAGFNIQFDFIPQRDSESHVKQLMDQGLALGTLSAVVLVGCPREVQEQVLLRGVPALVLGSDYSSTRQLPSVDADQFETGRLAAEYLLKRGHRRIALLMRETWFPGDRRMFEGVGRALDEAKLGHDALMLRNLAVDPAMLAADLQRMLIQEDPPTGCVCRTPLFAQAAIQAAKASGLSVPDDLELIVAGLDRQNVASVGLPSVSMTVNVEEQVAVGGRMLQTIFKGELPDPLHAILPVELVEPTPRADRSQKSSRQKRGAPRKSK
jgi:DNA-binding LacI/PurR family transcriptional regulator